MNYPRYKAYKNSGVAWVGHVPKHWDLRNLRYSAKISNGSDFKHIEVPNGGYPVLGSGGEFARVSTFLFDKPSVLLGRKGTIDNPLYIEEPFWTVDTLFYTEISTDTLPKYFYYFCRTIPFDFFQFGSTVPSMTQRDLYSIYMSLPPIEEQTAIATFLDRQTAKIDVLIAEQKRLIDLLKEKRRAIISHVVTKGLNPDSPMKDSGVEWLGLLPKNWDVKPIKQIADFINGAPFKPTEWAESGIPIIRIQNLNGSEDFNYFDGVINSRYLVNQGQLLFGWSGNRGTSFGPHIWNRKGTHVLNQHIFKVVSHNDIDKDWLYWSLKAVTVEVEKQAHGIIGMVHITKGDLGIIKMPVPNKKEQVAISVFLNLETAKIDTLVNEAQNVIELLQERRKAIILEAVTGKIDVSKITERR